MTSLRFLLRLANAIPFWAWALLLYVAVAAATIGQGFIAHPAGGECVCVAGSEPTQYMWSLSWWPYALLHGIDPLFTHVIWAPEGTNVAAAATIPAAAIALWPVTALFGPLVSYNVLAILSPALSAFTACLLCRRLTHRAAASLMGGFLFGFCSYQLSQSLGHSNLTLVFLLPVMVHLALRRIDGEHSRVRFIASMAIVFIVQALLSTEILLDAAVIGICALVVGYFTADASLRPGIDRMARELAVAAVVACVVLLPYLVAALSGDQAIRSGDVYGLDALNLIVPTPITWLGGHLFSGVSANFEQGSLFEAGGYMGLPIVAAFGAFIAATWRTSRATRFLASMFAVSVVLAFGAHLSIAGHALIPLPWIVLERVPLLRSLVPSRFAVFAELVLAVSTALWLSAHRGRPALRWLVALLGAVALFPNLAGDWWNTHPDNPPFFQTSAYRTDLKRNENVLVIPLAVDGESMLWQAEAGFYFSMPAGYISSVIPAAEQHNPAIGQLLGGSVIEPRLRLPSQTAPLIRTFLQAHHVRHIAIEPQYEPAWSHVLSRLAGPPQHVGGILLYTVN